MNSSQHSLSEQIPTIAGLPPKQGLYDPAFERDACGVGFVANMNGTASRDIVTKGLQILKNLKHRGATGCDPHTGDGAGILIQIPHEFFIRVCREPQNLIDGGFELPDRGQYGVGMMFLPSLPEERKRCESLITSRLKAEGLTVLGWRNPPVNEQVAGDVARTTQPAIRQVFVSAPHLTQEQLEIKLYVARQMMSKEIVRLGLEQGNYFYVPSFSTRTICYKGLLQPEQMDSYFIDLKANDFISALALVHQRFSTNTFPTWGLAHPFRYLAHNGEINTLRGNVNWMRAREAMLESPLFGADIKKIKPIITESGSDSAILDNALELLVLSGRSVPHALMMLVPEAWEAKADMSEELRAFYQYHSTLSEPWDGPAALSFTDGTIIGTALDRNGLRPARYLVTEDGIVALASEAGVLDFPPETIVRKGRVEPGSMMVADLTAGRILENEEIKRTIATRQTYAEYVKAHVIRLEHLPEASSELASLPNLADKETLVEQQQAFGYSDEDVRVILQPMSQNGEEPIGSMGTDTPLAVLSEKPQLLSNYFKQLFAQVTNPPIDPLRERSVMSLKIYTGRRGKFLNEEFDPLRCDLELDSPILTDDELAKIKALGDNAELSRGMSSATLSTLFHVAKGAEGLVKALTSLCEQAEAVIEEGHALLILSDRGVNKTMAPIPALLAVSAVHHHLIKTGKRTLVGLVVESGEPREVMHFALLIGYGASAINPYLALGTIKHSFAAANAVATVHGAELSALGSIKALTENYRKAIGKGLLKIMSKMGISTLMSYRGAQIFEAVGLSSQLIDNYFPRTPSRLEGIDLRHIVRDVEIFHKHAFPAKPVLKARSSASLRRSGLYQWQRDGEFHAYNPASIHKLQQATAQGDYAAFKEYSALVNSIQKKTAMLRGLLEFKKADSIPLSEVEPVEEIMKRFATGAMSFGSISKEAHETLAEAMNTIGGKSNTGEGGEDSERFGTNRRSAIKQVASGRFGVTSHYLVNAEELQIKVAQGAKPGEGGQLPGHKVDATIARVRHSVPGVTLISPPPHHDIYSIEDLAQLIYDLKNANSKADISVKLVSEVGVGVVAAGVAKAHADMILISGYDGGTGASPISSTRHAGIPWEIGLAETQQTLVLNDLRGRVRVQVDGQLKTGRDVVVAALLGAEEFGFSTAPLVVSGCILMRKCHLNTCPVGIATQKPELRAKYTGKAEHIINFFRFIAEEVRELMSELGFRTMNEMIGRSDALKPALDLAGKAATLDLSAILYNPGVQTNKLDLAQTPLRCVSAQEHGLEDALDHELIALARPALESKRSVSFDIRIRNVHRTVGTLLGSEISRRFGEEGLPENTINATFTGTAGQSFGAFVPKGVTMRLVGEGNDYVGKGLSGGTIIVVPNPAARFNAEENVIAGNTILYGATSGTAFIRGQVGERFAVRNSGATVVVEGVGDHACEYMTGGTVVVLGKTGHNFAAGMSGGVAFVYDPHRAFPLRCNHEMVDVINVLDAEQQERLHSLISRHVEQTGSAIGKRILESWNTAVQDFALVFPHEYRKYLQRTRPQPAQTLVELSKELAV